MSTHIKYIQRIPNSQGDFPRERRGLELGGTLNGDSILLTIAPNPEAETPGNLLLTIDACHAPQDFADLMATVLHGMAGDIEGLTNELIQLAAPEPSGIIQTNPLGADVVDGEIIN